MNPPDVPALQRELKRICIEHCIMEKGIEKARAGLGVKASELEMEGNMYRRDAICARMVEMEAWIDAEKVKLEISGLNMFNLTTQLDMLLGMEPEYLLPPEKKPLQISGHAPDVFMPPPPPRL